MKIEVGKSYRNGYGEIVTITGHDPADDWYPFRGIWDGQEVTYTENGVFYVYDPEGGACLVSEVGPAGPAGPALSANQVGRLLDALNLARNGCSDTAWEKAMVALEEALCPEEGGSKP